MAVGPEDTGLYLFSGSATPEEAVVAGFGLEMGLRDFYLSMRSEVSRESTRELFGKLAEIELIHQEHLAALYRKMTGTSTTVAEFAVEIAQPAMEGGLTTEEYLELYKVDLESEIEVLSMAMAIEAQALDLYLRAAKRSDGEDTRKVLLRIADEERGHIKRLSDYIDQQQVLT